MCMYILRRLDVSVHSKFQCTSGCVPSLSMNAGNPRETVPGQRSSRARVSLWPLLLASSHTSFLSLARCTSAASIFPRCEENPGLDWSYLEHVDCSSRDVPVHRLSWSMALTARLACMSLINPLCFKRSLLRTSLDREWRGGLGWRNVPKECELDFLIALPRARMRSYNSNEPLVRCR